MIIDLIHTKPLTYEFSGALQDEDGSWGQSHWCLRRGMSLKSEKTLGSRKLLLMGSSAFKPRTLPIEIRKKINEAVESE
jgi:hypothetical protein